MGKKFGISFSLSRALGISGLKSQISHITKVPTTRIGRQRKVGDAAGCCIPFILLNAGFFYLLWMITTQLLMT